MSTISLSGKTYDEFPPDLNSSGILMKRIDLGYEDGLDSCCYPSFKWFDGYKTMSSVS